ncbi:ABC transporter [Fusarium albosuccineum]|uniref:ABC transporter n=1 Tax=Fusarium albosuccineum TaxID=1237068 RepID=A0A8H4L555_9HYPO|nr:ABC transporter [Fusarium albosuccineum]
MDSLLYNGRNTALLFLSILTAVAKLHSFLPWVKMAAADETECPLPYVYAAISWPLAASYLIDTIVIVVQSLRSSGMIPNDTTAAFSNVVFFCVVVVRIETFSAKETSFSRKACAFFWLFLLVAELVSSVRIFVRPLLPSPYAEMLLYLPVFRAISCLVLLVLLVRSHRKGYKLVASDSEDGYCDNNNEEEEEEEEGEEEYDDGDYYDDDDDDEEEIRKKVKKEVKKRGGWLPYLRSFHILLKFTTPPNGWLKRLVGIVQPLQTAMLIDAIDTRSGYWNQFAVFLFLRFVESDMCLGVLISLSWIGVDLARQAQFETGVQSKVMLLDYFHMRSKATNTIKAIDNAGRVDKLLDTLAFDLLPNAGALLFAGYGMWQRFGTNMMLIIVCMTVAYVCCETRYVAAYLRLYSDLAKARDSKERRRQDGIRGWMTVSAHNMIGRENELHTKDVDELMDKTRLNSMSSIFYNYVDEVIFQVASGLCWALIIFKVLNFEATIGSLTAFLGLWDALMKPINYFKSVLSDGMEELTDMARLKSLMEQEPRIQDGDKPLELAKGEVRFENVSLSYTGKRLVVNNLSLTIKGGTKVAFVGPSGTGKSTLVKMVARLLLPTQGRIFIDGVDIATVSKDSLHSAVGIMLQDPHIFDSTIIHNVAYSKPDATLEEVQKACKSVGIHETIMHRKGGYEAKPGPGGANFSGGEKQRLASARLILSQPGIGLIDEGTSALDSETEADIKRSIEKLFGKDKTLIIIAHRLSSIRHLDRIIVFGEGCKIIEDGTHDELVALKGKYAQYWKMHMGIDDRKLEPPLKPKLMREERVFFVSVNIATGVDLMFDRATATLAHTSQTSRCWFGIPEADDDSETDEDADYEEEENVEEENHPMGDESDFVPPSGSWLQSSEALIQLSMMFWTHRDRAGNMTSSVLIY